MYRNNFSYTQHIETDDRVGGDRPANKLYNLGNRYIRPSLVKYEQGSLIAECGQALEDSWRGKFSKVVGPGRGMRVCKHCLRIVFERERQRCHCAKSKKLG